MKKILLTSFAIGSLCLASCSNDEYEQQITPTAKEVTINFGANVGEDARTVYDPAADVKVAWVEGDKVRLYDNDERISSSLNAGTINSNGSTSFSYTTTVGNHKFAAVYPYAADNGFSGSTKLKIELPNSQTYITPTTSVTEGSFDPAADILFAKSINVNVTEATANVPLVFTRPLAVCKFALKIDDATVNALAGDKIQSVKISVEAANSKYLTGRFYEELASGTIVDASNGIFYYGYKSYVDLTPDNSDNAVLATGSPISVWAVIAPVKLESGDKLVFDIVTDKNTIKKEITIGTSGLEFIAGKRNATTINLKNATIVNLSDAISVTPESLSWAADATDAKTITVTSSDTWTASIDNTADFTLTPTSGANGDTFTVTPKEANTGTTAKTATVTLTRGTATATVTCSQAAAGVTEQTATFDYSVITEVNTTVGDISITTDKNGGNAPAYNSSSKELRIYRYNSFTLTAAAGKTITKVEYVFSGTDRMGYDFGANEGTYTTSGATGTWTGSSNSVTFTNGGDASNNVQVRLKSIVVTYN